MTEKRTLTNKNVALESRLQIKGVMNVAGIVL